MNVHHVYPSWAECHAAGMAVGEAAAARGVTVQAARSWEKRSGLSFERARDGVADIEASGPIAIDPVWTVRGSASVASACRGLWVAVLGQLVEDELKLDEPSGWFESEDFRVACDLAGVHPSQIIALLPSGWGVAS